MPTQPPQIINMGCRLNMRDGDVIREAITKARDAVAEGLIVLNSCAVTGEAVRQSRQRVRRLHRDRPDAQIVVTGCAAQIDPDQFRDLPGVARVLGNEEKFAPESYQGLGATDDEDMLGLKVRVSDIMSVREHAGHLARGYSERTRAFVEVQTG
ncbi:MAG: tRNA (N(6)-L-threonylcarbamoyladenosine(37)-C(2))-methylthiotransferase MtaB, partial [Pseudomonadota bacterium]